MVKAVGQKLREPALVASPGERQVCGRTDKAMQSALVTKGGKTRLTLVCWNCARTFNSRRTASSISVDRRAAGSITSWDVSDVSLSSIWLYSDMRLRVDNRYGIQSGGHAMVVMSGRCIIEMGSISGVCNRQTDDSPRIELGHVNRPMLCS